MTTTATRTVQVGDVFRSSWGYDQTNVDFYVVTDVTPSGKSVRVLEARKVRVTEPAADGAYHSSYSEVRPVAEPVNPNAEPRLHRLRTSYDGTPAFTVNSYADAYLVDDLTATTYETSPGWGH